MTSRRGTLVEDGACELLRACGFQVRVVPSGISKRYPPAHLVAARHARTRFIRVRKISRMQPTPSTLAAACSRDIVQFRKYLSRNHSIAGLSCELWVYSLKYGFRCFEVLADTIREIPKPTLEDPAGSRTGGRL
ncbi:MAG: hypothetical protein WC586_06440 [Methanoregula sp.]